MPLQQTDQKRPKLKASTCVQRSASSPLQLQSFGHYAWCIDHTRTKLIGVYTIIKEVFSRKQLLFYDVGESTMFIWRGSIISHDDHHAQVEQTDVDVSKKSYIE